MFTTIQFKGHCDEWLPIQNVLPSKENSLLYGDIKLDRNYIELLKSEFKEKGLLKAIEVWKTKSKNKPTKGGHNRYVALSELGELYVPVIYSGTKPKKTIDIMEEMVDDNMRKPQTTVQKYIQVKTLRDQRYSDIGSYTDADVKKYCTKVQTTWKTYEMLRDLDEKRPDLFERVADNEDGLSVMKAFSIMKEDEKDSGHVLAAAPALDDLIKKEHIIKTILSLQTFMNRFYNLDINIDGTNHKLVPTYQENILSGIVHETFSNVIAKILTNDKQLNVSAPKNQRAYDLIIPGYCWEPEVKVAKWTGKNIANIHWQGKKPKSGYYFLIAVDHTIERFFVAYGFIQNTMWEKSGQLVSLYLENVYKSGLKTFLGEIKEVNGEYQIHLDKPSI